MECDEVAGDAGRGNGQDQAQRRLRSSAPKALGMLPRSVCHVAMFGTAASAVVGYVKWIVIVQSGYSGYAESRRARGSYANARSVRTGRASSRQREELSRQRAPSYRCREAWYQKSARAAALRRTIYKTPKPEKARWAEASCLRAAAGSARPLRAQNFGRSSILAGM